VLGQAARRNFTVSPVTDGSHASGIGIVNLDQEQTRAVMDGDPGVQAGVFTYEMHACRSFAGDRLPA
jgi:hypothetical protein